MALYIRFDKSLQGPSGMIPLKRGDDWKLEGKVLERYAGYEREVDLSGIAGATGFFGADPDALLADDLFSVPLVVLDAACGKVRVDVAASGTPLVALAEDGIGMYATLDLPSRGLVTAPMESPLLEIEDRGFAEP